VTATHAADGTTVLVKADDATFRNSTFRGRVDVDRKNASVPRVEDSDFADCERIGFDG